MIATVLLTENSETIDIDYLIAIGAIFIVISIFMLFLNNKI